MHCIIFTGVLLVFDLLWLIVFILVVVATCFGDVFVASAEQQTCFYGEVFCRWFIIYDEILSHKIKVI